MKVARWFVLIVASFGGLPLVAQGPPEDAGMLTRVRVAVDSTTWDDVRASAFLPEAFVSVDTARAGEVSLCGRFACLIMLRASAATPLGTVQFGAMPARGGTLVPPSADSLPTGVVLVRAESPPPPDFMIDPDSLGIIYDLVEVVVAVPPDAIVPLGQALHRAGIAVTVNGTTATIRFGAATLHLTPAWDVAGLERAAFLLRRPAPGDPTYRFGPRSALRFGPGRSAAWTF